MPPQHAPAPGEVIDEPPADGRTARAVRTRLAIADALLELLEEGDLQPTAARIAERAGVSLRLVYHHYGDLESVYVAAIGRQFAAIMQEVPPIPLGGPLDDRITSFVDRRAAMHERMMAVRRAVRLMEPFSPRIQQL